jgi:hypothetical protein
MAGQTTEQDEINHIRMIDAYHVSIDFGGFAYHACAFPSGRAYQTGDFNGSRAHVWGRNHELLGWVLIGNYESQLPSSGGLAAAAECERAFNAYLGRQVPLKGHRDWALPDHGTACPSRVRERLTTIRNLAKEDDMEFSDEQKAYLADLVGTIVRSTAWAVAEKGMSAAAKRGDPDWTPPLSLKEVMNKLSALEAKVDAIQAGTAPRKVVFPGATIKVPPVDMPVE